MQDDIVRQPPKPKESADGEAESTELPVSSESPKTVEVSYEDSPAQPESSDQEPVAVEVHTQADETTEHVSDEEAPNVDSSEASETPAAAEEVPDTTPETSETEHPAADKPPEVVKKSTKPIGVIVAAVVVCSGLIGGAIYAGTQTGKNKTTSTKAAQSATQAAIATTGGAAQEINDAINDTNNLQDPAQDLNNDLSDASLGL